MIVDDSAFMRKLIGDFFIDNEKIEVVGIARNGRDAIEKIKLLQPNVVIMDIEMPDNEWVRCTKANNERDASCSCDAL